MPAVVRRAIAREMSSQYSCRLRLGGRASGRGPSDGDGRPSEEPTMIAIGRTHARTLMVIMLVAVSAATTACSMIGTRGEGAIASETRQTDPFTRVESGTG